ncbi:MAG: response regulator transcription factor [Haliea sp.]
MPASTDHARCRESTYFPHHCMVNTIVYDLTQFRQVTQISGATENNQEHLAGEVWVPDVGSGEFARNTGDEPGWAGVHPDVQTKRSSFRNRCYGAVYQVFLCYPFRRDQEMKLQVTSVVIAEDHTILREGLCALISTSSRYTVVAEAHDGLEAVDSVREHQPDIVLMDISMPAMNGIEAIRAIKKRRLSTRMIALTVHRETEYVLEALRSGVSGYLLKDSTHRELMLALDTVSEGKTYLSPGVSSLVVDGFLSGRDPIETCSPWQTLTDRERQVLKMIGEGYRGRMIAESLCISMKTVEKHRSNLMHKLDLHSVSALTTYCLEHGLVGTGPGYERVGLSFHNPAII